MQVTCAKCNETFSATEKPLDNGGAAAQCPHCGFGFTLHLGGRIPLPVMDATIDPNLPHDAIDDGGDGMAQVPGDDEQGSDPHHLLKKYFGYPSFRPNQLEIIETLLAGQDAFVLMPTGSGKSICYQIPAMIRKGVAVVISPLIALMQDQVQALRQNGIRAAFLNSSLSIQEAQQVQNDVRTGALDLLYVAPERLLTESFQALLQGLPLSLFAIDEAHCVSQWGHDFRPEYLGIAGVTRQFNDVPRIALTATADPQTRQSILTNLKLTEAPVFVASFDRPNIRYRVGLKNNDKTQLLAFLQDGHAGHSGIVYVRTRKRADSIAAWLKQRGYNALPYHAGLAQATRMAHQHRFLQEEGVVMVATIAFGMGIDKPDVRFVAHLDLPASVEAYYQETGRAGRDGLPADAWMIYSLADVVAMRKMQDLSEGSEDFKRIQLKKLEAMLGFCETVACRRQILLDYFGEHGSQVCGNCDTCLEPLETWDATEAAQMALSCVYRTGQRFGAAYLTDVLMGKTTERIRRFGHDQIKTFGVGHRIDHHQWRSVFRQLMAMGLLSVNLSRISGFRLTEASWPILKGETAVAFRSDPRPIKAKKRSATKTTAARVEHLPESDQPLWEKLRELRLSISKELDVPPFVIFHDRTLKELVVHKPTTRQALLKIYGVGENKAQRYGDVFIEALKGTQSDSA